MHGNLALALGGLIGTEMFRISSALTLPSPAVSRYSVMCLQTENLSGVGFSGRSFVCPPMQAGDRPRSRLFRGMEMGINLPFSARNSRKCTPTSATKFSRRQSLLNNISKYRHRFQRKLQSSLPHDTPAIKQRFAHKGISKMISPLLVGFIGLLKGPAAALAMAGGGGAPKGPVVPMKKEQAITSISLFLFLFTILALLHAAEIAITTLYPWKVREFAEEEEKANGKKGIFGVLNDDITRVLTTILVTSTGASIYATTMFTQVACSLFGTRGETYGAIVLTAITLFFVELLPKSIGVTNAERVARLMVPPITLISKVVSPLGIALSWLSKQVLYMLGLKGSSSDTGVSDSELRLIVMGARDSGTIDHSEGEMIKGVLNLQSQRVKEMMRPRVDIVAVPKDMSVASVLAVVRGSGYSRIPVYDGEIDNIVGIVLAKTVLDFFVKGVLVDSNYKGKNSEQETEAEVPLTSFSLSSVNGEATKGYVRAITGAELASRMETSISEAGIIEECYFVPDTANGWSVLEEMRKRRIHLAVVVDEYGGTEGLVSLEDIVEEVVGEIYDEDDEDDFEFSEDSITLQDDGTFIVRGDADLEDCDMILGLQLGEEDTLKEFGTISGFLCMCAGEIPKKGDFIASRGWKFEIADADPKRILSVRVERLVGFFDEETDDENQDVAVLGFLRNKRNSEAVYKENEHSSEASTTVDAESFAKDVQLINTNEALRLENLVEESEKKRSFVKEMIEERKQMES